MNQYWNNRRVLGKGFYTKGVFILIILISNFLNAQTFKENLRKASLFFESYNLECEKENAELWGISYCDNLILDDNMNRILFSKQSIDIEGKGVFENGLYCYFYPETMTFSPGVKSFGKKVFAILNFDEVDNKEKQLEIAFHEMTHKIQRDSNFTFTYNNSHIDKKMGRVFVRLEASALSKALSNSNKNDSGYVIDALYFRNKRQSLYPNSKQNETRFELTEGLAKFSGMIIVYKEKSINLLLKDLQSLEEGHFESRTFGYFTGAAYAFLNKDSLKWNHNIYHIGDITEITKRIYNINDSVILNRDEEYLYEKYNYSTILKEEENREKELLIQDQSRLDRLKNSSKLKIQNLDNYIIHLRVSPYKLNDSIIYYSKLGIEDEFGYIYSENECFMIGKDIIFLLPDNLSIKEMNNNYCDEKICIKLKAKYRIVKYKNYYIIERK
ncbi:MAG: uncharacterized protein H6Q16_648 [Bacteroidetes bacterium]|nr:uncharacterized protein [Bacteroidota bacterium]